MSYTHEELGGVCAMSPAFATADAGSMTADRTIDVDNLADGLDRVIRDGIHMIATLGTFGQVWNLLWEEWQDAVVASIQAVNKRVPLMLGVTTANPREITRRMKFVREQGGEGVLLGLPYYDPLPVRDIPTMYREVAELFPDISIMIYHNPPNHRVHIPVAAFPELVKIPNIVAMKDSHRNPAEFLRLHDIIDGHIAHVCNTMQLYPYLEMGAKGCWNHSLFSGPWPVLAAWNAAKSGDVAKTRQVMRDMQAAGGGAESRYGEITTHAYAGYIKIGEVRPPFAWGMRDPEARAQAEQKAKKGAEKWLKLCEKYRPEVEASGVLPVN
jgi:4-hydroxy-tetrahydrodipicolinate synthase